MPLYYEAHLEIKILKSHGGRTTFRSSDVEKMHAIITQNTILKSKYSKR